jgi:sugar lactone lactonase YvrE
MRHGGDAMELVRIVPAGNTLGESPVWDGETGTLWWTDIQERRLFRYDSATEGLVHFRTPERLCSFGLVAGSGVLICAFETGVGLYEPGSDSVTWLARPRFRQPGLRFNDGRVDRQGRFWCGTMVEGAEPVPAGSLHSLARVQALATHETGISISNGICWSPDSTRFYFADSPRRTIFAYDFDTRSGTIANRRVFAQTPDGAYPDGANVDAEGCLWSAHWGAGRVVRYTPDGNIDSVIEVPAEQPTCVAFGGADLDLLFITTARDGLNDGALLRQPRAGDVFVYKLSVPGLPDGRFS